MKRISLKILTSAVLFFLFLVTNVSAAQAEWTNVCGSGFRADWTGREGGACEGCSRDGMFCSGSYVYKFVCQGWTRECGGNGTTPFAAYGPSGSQSISNEACNTTIQIDVFREANYQGLIDYMVWYTGPCPTQPPPPPPTSTPVPTSTPRPTSTPVPTSTPYPTATPTLTPGPSSTPTPTTTPKPTTPAHYSSCDSLRVVSGGGALVPAKFTFEARASDSEGEIQLYRYYFGDGNSLETTSDNVEHTYEVSGIFYQRVYVKDSKGNWKTSQTCTSTVKVESAPIETHKSDCSDLFILSGQHNQAPTNASFQVTGYDNKGPIQRYRLVFGDGQMEQSTNYFSKFFSTAGSYEVRAYIQDSQGNWKGGEGSCRKTLYVNTKPIVTQPKTGTPLLVTLGSIGSGVLGLGLRTIKKRWL